MTFDKVHTPLGFGVSTVDDVTHKFGHNPAVGTGFALLTTDGIWRTPQPAAATQLRVKAGNANDTAAGSGARSVFIQGIDATGARVNEIIATAGASAGANSTNSYIRLLRAYVASSGTYADPNPTPTSSHAADIVIENAAGTEDWGEISATDYAEGQSEIGCWTTPTGSRALLTSVSFQVETTKKAEVRLYQRQSILDAAAPYQAVRLIERFVGLTDFAVQRFDEPLIIPANTDLFCLAKVASGTGEVSVEMEILEVDD